MKHELGLPFPSRNLPIKFGTNPSRIFLGIVDTETNTDKPTLVKTYSLAFAGITSKHAQTRKLNFSQCNGLMMTNSSESGI